MISLTGSSKKQQGTNTSVRQAPTSGRSSHAEMERLREIILGETADRVEDISRQVTSRDARVRRLVEDIPDAINKNTTNQSSLTRLANALRVPIEEALNQSVQGDQQKIAGILAPALARALPQTLSAFVLGLPIALARRVYRVACPWAGGSVRGGHARSGRATVDHAFQVDRICLIEKNTLEVLRTCDVGFDDDATLLEVDHLFVQFSEALRSGSPNPTASLRYPPPKTKNEAQGMLVLEGDHTILAAYYKGQPASWLRDRLQDLADEADTLAQATITESSAGQPVEHRLESLDTMLKKGLVCYLPEPQAAGGATNTRPNPWWQDAAVVAAVIGVVWLVASVSQAATRWNDVVQRLDDEAGIVVTGRSWLPGRSITGLRDPLAPDPSALLSAGGYPSGSVKLHFSSFLSDEAPFKEQRQSLQDAERDSVRREIANSYAKALSLMEASLEMRSPPAAAENSSATPANDAREVIRKELLRTLLELPADANFEFKNGTVTIPISLPKATRTRIREVIKAIPWVKELNEANLPARTSSRLPGTTIPYANAVAVIQQTR